MNFEAIPSQFKMGIIAPIYKGKGKDHLLPGSYRGITLTSVIAKTFEHFLLDCMLPVLSDNCTPHLNQTAYQSGVSSADATFSCQETISKFIRDRDSVYSCFYDLASAFDTVEYPVLLSHLKKEGVSGKAWHLIKDWYTDVSCTCESRYTSRIATSGASKLRRASASRGKPVLIGKLARSLGFHAVTPEHSSFRENNI